MICVQIEIFLEKKEILKLQNEETYKQGNLICTNQVKLVYLQFIYRRWRLRIFSVKL